MTYKGTVRGGVIVLDSANQPLPEGAKVDVLVLETPDDPLNSNNDNRTLYDVLKDVIGTVSSLPEDASYQHDHYLYGTPKKP